MSQPPGPGEPSITEARRAREAAAAGRLSHDRPHPVVAGSTGLLGGTFDPIHYGHLALAEEAREALGLERILFVPAGLPPHKADQRVTAPDHRRAMVELAITDNPAFAISTFELDRPGPSYTVETLEHFAAAAGPAGPVPALTFILSAEAFGQLLTWRQPHRILALARLAVSPRPGFRTPSLGWLEEHFPGQEDRVVFLDGPLLGHSASEIRRRVAQGRSIRYQVPPAVAAYIADHELYTDELWRKN